VTLVATITIGTARDLAGTFSIDQVVAGLPFTAHVDGSVLLTVTDEGPDETNYLMSGTTLPLPQTYSLGSGISCQRDSNDPQAIPKQARFKVLKTPTVATRWTFEDSYAYTCTSGSQSFPGGFGVNFMTRGGAGCASVVDVPCADAKAPMGTFAMTCLPGNTVVATWSLGPH
jgi:hypothetical protein